MAVNAEDPPGDEWLLHLSARLDRDYFRLFRRLCALSR
jgi:hypothetical protein